MSQLRNCGPGTQIPNYFHRLTRCYSCGVLFACDRTTAQRWVCIRGFPTIVAVVVVSCLLTACAPERGKTSATANPLPTSNPHQLEPGVDPALEDPSDLDKLRALGYLDYSDAPTQTPGEGTIRWDREAAYPGYTLVVYSGACSCDLITLDGAVVKTWSDKPCRRWEQARLLPGGDLLVVGTRSNSEDRVSQQMAGRFLLRLSWDGEVVWRRQLAVHHDVEVTPDGKLLTLLFERRVIDEIDPEVEVWDDVLALLSLEGEVLEKISLYDVLASSKRRFPLQIAGRSEKNGERWIDLFHCNSAEWMKHPDLAGRHPVYELTNVLITSRHQDAVMVINWRTRELVWHWGRGELSGPHAGTVQDDGKLLIFDNGLDRAWSRVVEVDPVAAIITRSFTTPRKEDFRSRVMGSNQRLPNGNVLITNSVGGQGIELTSDGQPAWVYLGTRYNDDGYRIKIARMRRIPTQELGLILALEHAVP